MHLRVIDDILFIWTDTETDLEKFLNELNTKHASIKFEYGISKERVTLFTMGFFGLKITKTKNNLSMKPSSQKHISFVSIACLFFCVWSLSRDITMTSFLCPRSKTYVTWKYNRICLPKTIWKCLRRYNYVFLVNHCYT